MSDTRTQAVYDPRTKKHKKFQVIDITEKVRAEAEARKADRLKLKEEIYGTQASPDATPAPKPTPKPKK